MATFTNQAFLTYRNGTVSSNVVVGELIGTLDIVKTATTDTYTPGVPLTYTIALTNARSIPQTGITVTDDLGAYTAGGTTVYPLTYVDGSVLVFQNGVLQPSPAVSTAGPLTFSGITVPAGGNTLIVYNAIPGNTAPRLVGSTLINTVTASGGTLTAPVTAQEEVGTADEPRLTIEKSIDPTPVEENGTLTYTFRVLNYGNTAAVTEDNIVITDDFDPILTGLTVTYGGVTWTQGTEYTYDETTGAFATTPGAITVPAATFTQNPQTGEYTTIPGTVTLTVTGTV